MAEKDYKHKHWRCTRCQQMVNLDAFRCGCSDSPSPWEPVEAPKEDPIQTAIAYAFLAMMMPGLWLSYPLLKMGLLMPPDSQGKRRIGEAINAGLVTLFGAVLFWLGVAVFVGYVNG